MKKETFIYSLAAVALMVASFRFGIMFSRAEVIANKPIPDNNERELIKNMQDEALVSAEVLSVTNGEIEEKPKEIIKIMPSTKMVYEYYYLGDGKLEIAEEMPPYFMLDLTESDVKEKFMDWDILVFNSDEVVMRKNIHGKSDQYYIVGVHEGYIAVFYATEVNGTNLKEITDMPVSSFPDDEQERLYSGIHVAGNDELVKVMEDYGS